MAAREGEGTKERKRAQRASSGEHPRLRPIASADGGLGIDGRTRKYRLLARESLARANNSLSRFVLSFSLSVSREVSRASETQIYVHRAALLPGLTDGTPRL